MSGPQTGGRNAQVGLDEMLDGRLGAEGVRLVAIDPMRHGLAELLATCLPGVPDVSAALRRTRFKPGRKLTANYELAIGGAGVRQVCVTWSRRRLAALPGPGSGVDSIDVTSPFTRLRALADDGQTSLLVAPADPAMPQLRRLNDPKHLGSLMTELARRTIPAPRPLDVRTVRYRPGQRHVLLVRSGPGRPGAFVKSDRDNSGSRAVPVAAVLAPVLARRCPSVRVAEPVGYSESDRAAIWLHAPGVPLSYQLTQSVVKAIQLVRLLGQAMRVWHESGERVPAALRERMEDRGAGGVGAEIEATRGVGEHIAVLLPSVWATYEAVLSHVAAGLDRLPAHDIALTHGDLKSDNVLVGGGQLHLLNLDRSTFADPAMDLGKFLADLHWWCRDDARASALGASFRGGYGASDMARWARADLLAEMYRLRFAARRCPVHNADWVAQVSEQVRRAPEAFGSGWS